MKRADRNGPSPLVFPAQLRAWRMRRGFADAASLARHLGVPASTITRLERGERRPSLAILCRISSTLDVPLDFLVRTTTHDIQYRLTKDDSRELERLRSRLLDFAACIRQGDVREGNNVVRELGIWLEHLTDRLRRRLTRGNGKPSQKRMR